MFDNWGQICFEFRKRRSQTLFNKILDFLKIFIENFTNYCKYFAFIFYAERLLKKLSKSQSAGMLKQKCHI